MKKIVITVSGGNIQSVISNTDKVQIMIIDHDNLNTEEPGNKTMPEFCAPDSVWSEAGLKEFINKGLEDHF